MPDPLDNILDCMVMVLLARKHCKGTMLNREYMIIGELDHVEEIHRTLEILGLRRCGTA